MSNVDLLKTRLDAKMSVLRLMKSNKAGRELARPVAEQYCKLFCEWHEAKFPGKSYVKPTWRKVWMSVR